jgi:asparagine synthase (glutamine-hydrolysing)
LAIFSFAIRFPTAFITILRVKKANITYLSLSKLFSLSACVKNIEHESIPGIFIEAGCALGGSAIVIADNKKTSRKFRIFDTFKQIPAPSSKDGQDAFLRYDQIIDGRSKGIKKEAYYGYEDNLIAKVLANFQKFKLPIEQNRVELHQGLFADVLIIDEPVALAHIDSDWYESITVALSRIVPKLSTNGLIIVDDYYDWVGAKQAIDDYFADKGDTFKFQFGPQLVIRKIK